MRRNRLLWIVCAAALLRCEVAVAQWTYGTSVLLNMPSAEMEESGTFMIGNSYLNKHTSTSRWFHDTFGYYFNITFLPFVEVSYNLNLHTRRCMMIMGLMQRAFGFHRPTASS